MLENKKKNFIFVNGIFGLFSILVPNLKANRIANLKKYTMMKCYNALFFSLLLICAACGEEKKTIEEAEESVETVLPTATNEVTVMELKETDFNHELISNGKLSARQMADLYFETAEPIAHIYVKNGSHVKKGDKIAELASFRLTNQKTTAWDALQKAELELKDVLIGQGYMLKDSAQVPAETMKLARIQSGYDQALAAYQLADYEEQRAILKAPFDGIIANLSSKEYNTASTSEPFCSIINDQTLEASFTVLENELPLIKPGDRVEVSPFAIAGLKREGNITEINPLIDENGMVKVKAAIRNGDRLYEGMNVQICIHRSLGKQLVVPKSAVVLRSGKQVVFTLVNNKANWVYVHTGLENATSYTITEGLKEGDIVITSGNINLAHEAPVKLIEE